MPEEVKPFDVQDTDLFKAVAKAAGRKKAAALAQQVYDDAMERAIKAVRAKATVEGRHGPVPVSIGALEVEIAIRQELTELAGKE